MKNKRLLVVDDDPEMRLALKLRLTANNYEVFAAADGVSAISEARNVMPDLILLDLGLPAGDGFIVLERIRSHTALASIPVIVVTGRDRQNNQARAVSAGANVFLQKPVQNSELLLAIATLLKIAPPPSQVIYDIDHCDPQNLLVTCTTVS